MALTLTQTVQITKRSFLGLIILILVFLVSIVGSKIYYYRVILPNIPKKVILPQNLWGALPVPKFPQSTPSANLTYTLATTTGALPSEPNIVKVYFVTQLGTTLTAPDNARALAQTLSFNNGPTVLNQTQYQFTDNNNGTLIIDLNTGNFSFTRVASTSGVISDAVLPNQDVIVNNFNSFLTSKNLSKADLTGGRSLVVYDQSGQKDSNTATVSLWPTNLGDYQIVTPTFTSGLIKARVGKAKDDLNRYVSLTYTYWSPDPKTTSTYPIITPSQAFTDLQNGAAAIIQKPTQIQNPIPITSVYLAYFESDTYSAYIEPVYVFQGANFVAYVAAIDPKFQSK